MRKFVLFLFVVCLFQNGICQSKKNQEVDIVSHTVQLGETVRMLSKKYLVDPGEIYKLNKFAVNGISQGMVLQIPVPRKEIPVQEEQPVAEETPQNEVRSEEQPVAEVEKPTRDEAERSVAKPAPKTVVKDKKVTVIDRDSQTEHTVEAGETLFSLSRKYNVSVDEIRMSNEGGLKKGLQVGQVIKIPSTKTLGSNESSIGSDVTPTNEVEKASKSTEVKTVEVIAPVSSEENTVTHKVEPKETLYSLSKRYNVTVDDIKSQNPAVVKNGLQIGQTLTIRKNN